MSDDLFKGSSIVLRARSGLLPMPITAPPKSIKSLSHLLEELEKNSPKDEFVDLYRGHSKTSYKLQPSLFRPNTPRDSEKNILRELISAHPEEFVPDQNTFARLVRMQHFSMPTRLLDLTYNPLVAMYFCCKSNKDDNGYLVCIRTPKSQIRYFDSDTVSCIANLAHLAEADREFLSRCATDEDVESSTTGKRLLHFIRAEKPYFEPKIKQNDLNSIIAVKPILNNKRILAQQGAFLLFGLQSIIERSTYRQINVSRFKIEAANKGPLMKQLDRININDSTMFPEIEYSAKYIMSKAMPGTV